MLNHYTIWASCFCSKENIASSRAAVVGNIMIFRFGVVRERPREGTARPSGASPTENTEQQVIVAAMWVLEHKIDPAEVVHVRLGLVSREVVEDSSLGTGEDAPCSITAAEVNLFEELGSRSNPATQ